MPTRPRKHKAQGPAQRGNSTERGYDARWRKARKWFLQIHPLCVECQRDGKVVAATVVDHVVPHRGDYRIFWNEANWQALCSVHHNQKTASGR